MIAVAQLIDLVEQGEVDTVIVAFTDMQGRLQGKRVHAKFFLDEVLEHRVEGCNYLLAVDVDMNTVGGSRASAHLTFHTGGSFAVGRDLAADTKGKVIDMASASIKVREFHCASCENTIRTATGGRRFGSTVGRGEPSVGSAQRIGEARGRSWRSWSWRPAARCTQSNVTPSRRRPLRAW